MRPSSIFGLLALPFLAATSAVTPSDRSAQNLRAPKRLVKRQDAWTGSRMGALPKPADESGEEGTVFNGKTVPATTYISGNDFNETIKDGYWFIEFFSPYCSHCLAFAPTWQTMYEFYYTSDPLPQSPGSKESDSDMNSFTRYYNFKFGKVDCITNGDACHANEIKNFPTMSLYKDGKIVDSKFGGRTLEEMSKWMEEMLESIRPGSRAPGGPTLPKVGDRSVETTAVQATASQSRGAATSSGTSTTGTTSTTTKSTISATKAVPSPKKSMNVLGKSVDLTAENFQRLVTTTGEPWFVKFYAPWCHHCQAMAPNWQGMARQMQGRLNIGEVNCEVQRRLCKDVKVRAYPTILFFRGGERIEYEGLRGLGDLISYSNKAMAVAEGVLDVNAAEFEELEKKEEVVFLYIYDHATTSEDFAALDRLVLSLVGHARLVKSDDPLLAERFRISTWPRMLVSRDGKPSYYNALSPRDMRDARRVLNWMQSVWLPIVPELTASNAREIMGGKLVVLGILSRDRPEDFEVAKREIKNAALEWIDKQTQAFRLEREELRDAKQLRIEEAEDRDDQRALRAAKSIRINMDDIERKEVAFAWVDGVFWERWVKTTFGVSVADGEKVVINDEDNHRYWDITMTGNPIVPSRTSILETLPRVVANPPKISPKLTTTPLGHVWWVVKGQVFEHPRVSIAIFMVVLLGGAVWGKRFLRLGNGGGYIKLGEKGAMDGLLGGNSVASGKVD